MLKNDYYEAIQFDNGNNFNVSKKMDIYYTNKLHWHPFIEVLVSLSDNNKLSINFTEYILNLNDIAIIFPGDLHSICPCTETSLLIIQFSNELFTAINELKGNTPLFAQQPYFKYDPLRADSERIVLLMKEFLETYESDTPFRETHMYSLLLNFFEKAGQFCLNEKKQIQSEIPADKNIATKKMAEACLYISQNCTLPLTLNDISDYMGMSKSHFAHLFKQYTNTTFVDFLTAERIKVAQSLFLNSDMQITDIAFDSGFSSLSSFNRSFKKITGMPPSAFRKTIIRTPE